VFQHIFIAAWMLAAGQHQHPASHPDSALFETREASGTAWLPDATPMFGLQRSWRGWDVMLHGVAFGQFLYEPGFIHRTGGFSTHQFGSVNWGMIAARRRAGDGRVGVRAMASLEPWTLRDCGSINLLATGELCEGDTIHDRQHPHDLLMELAADYDRPITNSLRWQFYAALAGEPALGPAAFPHRLSSLLNPIAPISHHWLDSSHISFGVVTTGIHNRRLKGEVSLFNGREPDANRKDIDFGALDSFAARLSWLPTDRLSLQVSAGHLREAEADLASLPRSDIDRFSASATYHRPHGGSGSWATTVAYGLNSGIEFIPEGTFDAVTSAALIETSFSTGTGNVWFGRGELVEKPGHDLHAHAFSRRVFTVLKGQVGYVREFSERQGLVAGVGVTVSLSGVPPELAVQYDGRVRPGFGVFLSLRPPRHEM
jgi:hypothetical protein